jgi:hypothetical protein
MIKVILYSGFSLISNAVITKCVILCNMYVCEEYNQQQNEYQDMMKVTDTVIVKPADVSALNL